MKVRLQWQDGVCFTARTNDGQQTIFDGAPEIGGQNRGMRPMEGFLAAAAACSAVDVAHILKKSKHPPVMMEVQVQGARDGQPAIFTAIHLHFLLSGDKLRQAAVERAVGLSVEKYCSALTMLAKTAAVTHSYEILPCSN